MRVAALMQLDDSVVTVRHRFGDVSYHLLPGGGVHWGESLEDAVIREVAEETGLVCSVGSPVILADTIAPDGRRHVVNVTFRCSVTGGAITAEPQDPRVEAVDLVAPHELSNLDLRPPISEAIQTVLSDPEFPGALYTGSTYIPDTG